MSYKSMLAANALMLGAAAASFAQGLPCGTADVNNAILGQMPEKQALMDELERHTQEFTAQYDQERGGGVKVIPIVFHVIHNNGPENISKAQILDAVRIINEDFRKLNSDIGQVIPEFAGITADSEIEFRLAKKDPQGNCTDGITRTVSNLTFSADNAVKNLISWNTARYLNVWVVDNIASGAGAYAHYPGNAPIPSHEGIVNRHSQLGSIGTSSSSNFAARTLSHEIGHYMNLRHTWGDSNDNAVQSNCSTDDGVSDTPNTIGSAQVCILNQNTCNSLDNVENYMDYSTCGRMFTQGQKTRMQAALNSSVGSRNNLWTATNLNNTGTNDGFVSPGCLPTMAFKADNEVGCEGLVVQYTDQSWGADEDQSWQWSWTFPGGTPASSTQRNPTVTYSAPGTYSATLSITNSAGTRNLTRTNLITITPFGNGQAVPFAEGMENTSFPAHPSNSAWNWRIESPGGTTWQRNTVAAATGSASARINLRSIDNGVIHSLITPPINMSGMTASDAVLRFKVAHAPRSAANSTERLRVYASRDCGVTWSIRYTKAGNSLSTVSGVVTGTFIPSASEWREETVSLTSFAGDAHVLLKFEATSDKQNFLYIDDVNLGSGEVSTGSILSAEGTQLFPNPTDGEAYLTFEALAGGVAEVAVRDAVGRLLGQRTVQVEAGENQVALSKVAHLPPNSVLLVTLRMGGAPLTMRLVTY